MADVSFRADRLDDLMERKGYSNGQLASMSRVSRTMIYYMRKGRRTQVSAKIVAAVADALQVSSQYLMGKTDDPSPLQKTMSPIAADIVELVEQLPLSKRHELRELGKALLAADQSRDVEMIVTDIMEQITRLAELDGGKAALRRLERELHATLGEPPIPRSPVTGRRSGLNGGRKTIDEPAQRDE